MYSSERFKKIIAKKMFQMTNLNSVRLQLYFNNCTIKNFVTLDLNLSSTFSFLAVFFAITGFHLKESDEVARGHYCSHASS